MDQKDGVIAQIAPEPATDTGQVVADQSFEELIETKYKDDFTAYFQKRFNERHKDYKELSKKVQDYEGVVQRVSERYKTDDLEKLVKAIDEDESMYEEEALESGMTVEQVKQFRTLERERNQLKAERDRLDAEQQTEAIKARWAQEETELKKLYPDFNFLEAVKNQQFATLVTSNVDLRTAYEVVNRDSILSGAVKKTEQAIRDDIKARGARPTEEGLGTSPSITLKQSPKHWTPEQFEEIRKRVARGEKITF